jgi:hypothetical protein
MQYHGGWLMSSKHQDQVSGHSSLQVTSHIFPITISPQKR